MRTYVKLTLTAATAAVVLGTAVSSVTARRIEVSSQRFHQLWLIEIVGQFATIRCPLTLEGSFHSKTTSKVAGQLVGYVSRITVGNTSCPAGHLTALTETIPWHITYEGFGGVLPRITEIRLLYIGMAFRAELLGSSCLAVTTNTEPAEGALVVEPNTGQITLLNPNPNRSIPTTAGCPAGPTVHVEGLSEVFAGGVESGNSTRITVRLVQ